MTREKILHAIEDLTAQIRTLSYSSSKEAAAQRADLQQQRRELRAQLADDALRRPLPITAMVCTSWPVIFLAVLLLASASDGRYAFPTDRADAARMGAHR